MLCCEHVEASDDPILSGRLISEYYNDILLRLGSLTSKNASLNFSFS
jgi:hypothetical protein